MTGLFENLSDRQPTTSRQGTQPETARQKVLFSGMDCLPGQLDLFEVDGQPEPPAGLDLQK